MFMKKRGQKVINVSGIGPALAQYAVDLITFYFKALIRVLQRYLAVRRAMLQERPVYAINAVVNDLCCRYLLKLCLYSLNLLEN